MANELVDRANRLNEEGKYAEALELYDQLLTQNHYNKYLLATVGTILTRNRKTNGMAITMLNLAIDKHGKQEAPQELWANLGLAYRHAGQTEKAIECLKKAISIEKTAGTLCNYGNMFVEQGNPAEAIKHLKEAIKLDPEAPLTHWNLSLALLETGQFDTAWEEYEYGERPDGMRPERRLGDRPKWDGKAPGRVALYGEQGIGDEIMFASMVPDVLKTNEVILDCHPRLVTLFEKSFGVKCYGTRKEAEVPWTLDEAFDYRIAMGSLGKFYRRSRASFPGTPYLKADAAPRGDRFRIGISWTGGRLSHRVAVRTVPLSWWGSIINNDAEFVSLQYTDDCESEIEIANRVNGWSIRQEPAAKAYDYYELAKFVKSCDLIITVCTSLVHLAGALGVPCWVMVPRRPAWRYMESGPMPWYRSVRLYRQPQIEESAWLPVVQRVGLDLSDLLAERRQKAA